ncbi:MAG: hypothetical protein C3F06_00360 [Candidatus Methanoperedenaceae archaeon]|nr:MAG: hypothetical protein C3F06_00360 [Candidatus Methanoperedenaceae archaeon]
MNSIERNEDEILIVEDSPTQAQMLKFLLEKHDYRVSIANNGKEALEMITMRKPAIIVSDIIMPEMDGFELCRHIKETGNIKDIPVILLTALCDPKDVLKGLECGANDFITKPYEEKYIVSRVQSMLTDSLSPETEKIQSGIKVFFGGQEYYITAQRQQILNLLLSTYETAVRKNLELQRAQDELRALTLDLERKVEERTMELKSVNEQLSRDIAERKRAEEQMRHQSTLLANVNDAIVASDENYKLTAWNAAAESLYGWKAEEVLGRSGLEIVQTDYGSEDKGEMVRVIEEAGRWRGEVTQMRKDGTRIPVEVSSIILHDENGRIAGYVSVNRDITGRKQTEDELRKYREHLEELVKERTAELERKNSELEHFNRVFVGRELRMIELKKIIAENEKKIEQLEQEKID